MDDPKAIREKALAEAKDVREKAKAIFFILKAIDEASTAEMGLGGTYVSGFFLKKDENAETTALRKVLAEAVSILYKDLAGAYVIYFKAIAEAKFLYEKSIAEAEAMAVRTKALAEAMAVRDGYFAPNRRYDSGRGLWL